MNEFNYSEELQKIIANRQLAQVNLLGVPTYKVAYILSANDKFITLAEVSSSATFAGIVLCRTHDVEAISIETLYLSELLKQISGDTLYQQAIDSAKGIQDFTMDGFAAAQEAAQNIVAVTFDDEQEISGRIIAHDSSALLVDEYSTEYDQRLARTYFKCETISRLTIDAPWLRTITRSLADKNL